MARDKPRPYGIRLRPEPGMNGCSGEVHPRLGLSLRAPACRGEAISEWGQGIASADCIGTRNDTKGAGGDEPHA